MVPYALRPLRHGRTRVLVAPPPGWADRSGGVTSKGRPKAALDNRIRSLTEDELAELELATDEALGRVEPTDGS